MKRYHRREWLNSENISADSTISAFHGTSSPDTGPDDGIVETPETILRIKDCYNAVKFQVLHENMEGFILKIRKIAEVCTEFADFLEKEAKDNEQKD